MAACITDRDCPDKRMCYNTSWTNNQAACLCSTWFGFSGDDCELALATPTATWRVVTNSISICGWALVMVAGALEMIRLLKFRREWSVTHTCQVQLLLGSAFGLIAEAIGQATSVRPDQMTVFLPGTNTRSTEFFYSKQIISTIGYCLVFLALSTLPCHWRELANQAFRPTKKKLSYIRPLIVFESLFIGLILLFVGLSMQSVAFIVAIPFVIVVVASYGICGAALTRVLTKAAANQQQDQKTRFLKSARNVASTSFKICVVGSVLLLLTLLFALLTPDQVWREISPSGSLSPPIVIGTLQIYSLIAIAMLAQYYLTATIRSSLSKSSSLNGSNANSNKTPRLSGRNRQVDSISGNLSAQPDSIVALDDIKDIKKKKKQLARKHEPRLRAITDMSEVQSGAQPHMTSTSMNDTDDIEQTQ